MNNENLKLLLKSISDLSENELNTLLNLITMASSLPDDKVSNIFDSMDRINDNNLNCYHVGTYISELLISLNVNPSNKGYKYLKDAIYLSLYDENMLSGITKILYPTIAKIHNSTGSRVERAIRHEIETSLSKSQYMVDNEFHKEVFGPVISDKATNSSYIAYIVEYIKNRQQQLFINGQHEYKKQKH